MPRIRKRYWLTALLLLSLAVAAGWWFRPLPLSGPWRAQIVDAETGQPIEGVIVLAVWDKRTFAWPHPDRHYHDSEEVVSDKDGRVVISARTVTSRHPFEVYIGPLLTIFKAGYGKWHYDGVPPGSFSEDPMSARRRADSSSERFSHGGVVMRLPRVKTLEERKEIIHRVIPDPDVPAHKYPHLLAAYNKERIRLGYDR
jgi:hypothetical protein